jgi:EAL domain-containing protein (putative c-di-GMP-specific phosphodiesterase class I)
MGHSLRLDVVAEGVETVEQYQFLKSLRWDMDATVLCDMMQGFLFSKPVPADELRALLRQQGEKGLLP